MATDITKEELIEALETKDRLIAALIAEKERLLKENSELHREINNVKWGYNG